MERVERVGAEAKVRHVGDAVDNATGGLDLLDDWMAYLRHATGVARAAGRPHLAGDRLVVLHSTR